MSIVQESDDEDELLKNLSENVLLTNVANSFSANKENKPSPNLLDIKSPFKMPSQCTIKKAPLVDSSNQINTQFFSATSKTTQSFNFEITQNEAQPSSTIGKRAKFIDETLQPTFPNSQYRASFLQQTTSSQPSLNSSASSDSQISSNSNYSPPKAITTNNNSFYGLPVKVKDLLRDLRKISALYEWQDELLKLMLERYESAFKKLKTGSYSSREELFTNLLYLSPTSAGKTLVAEMIILHCLLVRKKNCIFIMPFVSIVQEKVQSIAEFAERLDFYVEEFAGVKGRVPPLKRRGKSTLYICTIEKAHSLVNSLIETERISDEIGLVVADELHMIGDGSRGAIYEMILSKVNYASARILDKNEKELLHEKCMPIQIVATTATLENRRELAQFLNAFMYEREFRPVELKEYIKLDSQIFEVDKTKQFVTDDLDGLIKFNRELDLKNLSAELKKDDPDGLIALIKEVIPAHSCLIFCSTKKNCENLASLLCTHLPAELKQHKRDLKLKLFNELREENSNNICATLRQSIQYGIAYHHSGLTTEERQLIEAAYRDGVLCLLTCTSTLAAGVNLPAKRVIIRSPYVAKDFLSTHQYKQMIGRAGRAGLIDSVGESILIFKNIDRVKVLDLISGPMKRCESSFQCEDSKAVRLLVLSLIGLNLTHLGSQILVFFTKTLFFMQQKSKLDKENNESGKAKAASEKFKISVPKEFELISSALDYLLKNSLIKINDENSSSSSSTRSSSREKKENENLDYLYFCQFEITKLGMAAIKGNVDLDYVQQLYEDLKNGLKSMVLSNYLHLLYLCTPYDLVNSLNNVDFDIYARKYCNLSEDEIKCACLIGIKEEYIQKKRFQNKNTNKKVDENVVKRFYLTLVIYELWKTNNAIWKVANEFQLDRGFIQNIVQSAASFTSGVTHFCEHLDDLWPYKNLLDEFTKRLQYNCSSVDLIPLLELDSVRLARAKQLRMAGYATIEIIAASKPDEMCAKIKNLQLPIAKRIIKSANDRIEVLQAETDVLLEQLHMEQESSE